ncbi:MAG: TolC family protein, partial [Flavobacterium sp.]
DSLIDRAGYKPQIAGNVNAAYAPVINGYGYDTALSNGQSVSALISYNQKIFGNGRKAAQSESFRLIRESLSLNRKVAVKDLDKAVTSQYITAWGTSSQISYNEKTLELLRNEESILKKLTQNAVYKQTDYLIFDVTLKQLQLTILQLKQQYLNDLSMLNYLSGEVDNGAVSLKAPEVSVKAEKSKNVFLRQFETDSLKLRNSNAILNNTYKPSLSLLADAGYSSSFVYQAYKNFGTSAGIALTIPIYDGNQKSLQRQKNDAAMETVKSYRRNFDRQYRQQLLMLNQKLTAADETRGLLKDQLDISRALIEADKKLLVSGDVQITEYLLAISNLIAIQNQAAQVEIDKLQTINELNYWKSDD